MKHLLILILLLSLNGYSQSIGDPIKTLLENPDVRFHEFKPNYSEFVKLSDTLITMYIVSYKDDIVSGVDYLYPSIESRNKGFKIAFKEVCDIGDGLYLQGELLIVLKGQEILVRDVRYFKRKYTKAYK